MKPVLLVKTIVHRSGVTISLSFDDSPPVPEGDVKLTGPLCLLPWHRGLAVRSKMRHCTVALVSVQIASAQCL